MSGRRMGRPRLWIHPGLNPSVSVSNQPGDSGTKSKSQRSLGHGIRCGEPHGASTHPRSGGYQPIQKELLVFF